MIGLDCDTIRDRIVPIEGYDPVRADLLSGEAERYRRSLEWIEPQRGGRLLDLGARGELVPIYTRDYRFRRVVCVDSTAIDGIHFLQHRDGTYFRYEAVRANLEADFYPFEDRSFDQVVAMEILEHLAVDPMFLLAEANRVLKPEGKLLLTTPNIASLASVYRTLWGQHPAIGRQAFGPGTMDRHHREYTIDEVVALVESAGFAVAACDTFDPSPPERPVRRVRQLLKLMRVMRRHVDIRNRGRVIRCACVKVGPVSERFPEIIYPRYPYYDYAAYDQELATRFGRTPYWQTNARVAEALRPTFQQPATKAG